MISPLLLFTLLTVTPVWTSKEIFTSWMDKGQGYEYILEIYTDRGLIPSTFLKSQLQRYIHIPPTTILIFTSKE